MLYKKYTALVFVSLLAFGTGCAEGVNSGMDQATGQASGVDVPDFARGKADGGIPLKLKGKIGFGETRTGGFADEDHFHEYSFKAREGATVSLDISAQAGADSVSTQVFVLGPDNEGRLPLVDYDTANGPSQLQEIEIPKAGKYLVSVGTVDRSQESERFDPVDHFKDLNRYALLGVVNNLASRDLVETLGFPPSVFSKVQSRLEERRFHNFAEFYAVEGVNQDVVKTALDRIFEADAIKRAIPVMPQTLASTAILGVINNANIPRLKTFGLNEDKVRKIASELRIGPFASTRQVTMLEGIHKAALGKISTQIYRSLKYEQRYKISLTCSSSSCLDEISEGEARELKDIEAKAALGVANNASIEAMTRKARLESQLASRIVQHRSSMYINDIEQLLAIEGMTSRVALKLAAAVGRNDTIADGGAVGAQTVASYGILGFVNHSNTEEFVEIGLRRSKAEAITEKARVVGVFESLSDLTSIDEISRRQIQTVTGHLGVELANIHVGNNPSLTPAQKMVSLGVVNMASYQTLVEKTDIDADTVESLMSERRTGWIGSSQELTSLQGVSSRDLYEITEAVANHEAVQTPRPIAGRTLQAYGMLGLVNHANTVTMVEFGLERSKAEALTRAKRSIGHFSRKNELLEVDGITGVQIQALAGVLSQRL